MCQAVTLHHAVLIAYVTHTNNATKFPGYGYHLRTIFDTVAKLPLYIVMCTVLCKFQLILGASDVGVR